MTRSRMKKFEQLRQDILNENATNNNYTNESLKQFAQKLANAGIDVEKNNVYKESKDYIPHHQKSNIQKVEQNNLDNRNQINTNLNNSNDNFDGNNDYMSDFLSEVKAYNLEKGYRQEEDTKANLLHELNIKPEIRPFGNNYKNNELFDSVNNDKYENKKDNYSLQEQEEIEDISLKVESMSNEDFDISKTMDNEIIQYNDQVIDDKSQLQTIINNQTQELKTDFINQKKDIDAVNNKIDRVNLILNITLGILFVIIIIVLIIFVYQLLKINGVF